MKLVAQTLQGLENVLATELSQLGATSVNVGSRAVYFEGDLEVLYKCNLLLRTATRILCPIYSFSAPNEMQLYKEVSEFDWSDHLTNSQTFSIDSISFSEHFTNSRYVSLKIKDAIVDQFRKATGVRPSVDTENPDIRIHAYVKDDRFSISLDSSGEPLFKRGYRTNNHPAPLNEVLAAGLLRLSEWDSNTPLHDPMCGSGTIILEAFQMANNIPAGLIRKGYCLMNWTNFDDELWNNIKNSQVQTGKTKKAILTGSDISSKAIAITKKNASNLPGALDLINLKASDFMDVRPDQKKGTLIMNPPYGHRMHHGDTFNLYRRIGDHLKEHFTGFDAWIISSNKEALKHIGLRASKKHTVFNGPAECKFHKYSLY